MSNLRIKIFVGSALALFSIIIISIGVAGKIIYDQKNGNPAGNKLASKDPNITTSNPANQTDASLGGIPAVEVARHSSPADCWMIIEGSVYDFTKFLSIHPGNANVMTPYCGKDGTRGFATKDTNPAATHTSIARELLNQYYLGKLGTTGSAVSNESGNQPMTLPDGTTIFPTVTLAPIPTNANTNTDTVLTTSEVARHSNSSDCWIIVSNDVYSVSAYLNMHPGGSSVITAYCGGDATTAFATKNTGSSHTSYARSLLASFLIGRIGSVITPNPTTVAGFTVTPTRIPTSTQMPTPLPTQPPGGGGSVTLTTAQVATHNTLQDCWVIISGKVYNLTPYIPVHPGGQREITNYCGADGSTGFATRGGTGSHSNTARNLLNGYYIGDLGSSIPVGGGSTPTPTQGGGGTGPTPTSSTNTASLPSSVLQRYPDAVLIGSIKYEDDGRAEFRISTGGQCRKIKTSSSGQIREDESC